MAQGPPAHSGEPRVSSPSSELVLTLSSVPSHSSWSDSCLWTYVHHSCPDSGPPPHFHCPQCFSRPPEADPHRLNHQVVKRQWEHQRWDKKEIGHFCPTSVMPNLEHHCTLPPSSWPHTLYAHLSSSHLEIRASCACKSLGASLPLVSSLNSVHLSLRGPIVQISFLNDLSWILISTRALMHISSLCADLFIHYLIL